MAVKARFMLHATTAFGALLAAPAFAQTAPASPVQEPFSESVLDEIVVTAQKREQSLNSVGLAVQAITAESLASRGITDVSDLTKAVPGFTYTPSPYATPVYTLRGVGLYDSGFAASPSVSVYVDEVPLAFPVMTKSAGLDVERVEILKGPQGILFGQSSTGGAVNYIAAKPTTFFDAGANLSINDFGEVDASGFLSGPITETLAARLALRAVQGGAWQESTSRDDELGDKDLLEGRLLLHWQPTDALRVAFNLNGFADKSDPLAPSLIRIAPLNPALLAPGFADSIPAASARDADWPEGQPRADNSFHQLSARVDYDLSDEITITSITASQRAEIDQHLPFSGTPFHYQDLHTFGYVESWNQELRLAGAHGGLNWLTGLSYEHVEADDHINYDQRLVTNNQPFPFLAPYRSVETQLTHETETLAIFANADYKFTNGLGLRGGLRYTQAEADGSGCSFDDTSTRELAQLFEFLQTAVKGTFVPIATGQCASLDENYNPVRVPLALDDENLSWRFGVDYMTEGGVLFFANYSRGFKSGIFPNVAASAASQYAPAAEERLDAYEIGVKAPLLDRRVQVNASAFYYDYTDKQFRGTVVDPLFGKLERELNIPQSRIAGIEAEIIARPIEGLMLTAGGTWIDSSVTSTFETFTSDGTALDADGSQLPFTPEWQLVADAQYTWNVGELFEAFVGGNLYHHSSDNSSLRTAAAPAADFDIPEYTTVDLRAGFGPADGGWRASAWIRNATDEHYWNTAFKTIDNYFQYNARPRTFGVTLSVNLN